MRPDNRRRQRKTCRAMGLTLPLLPPARLPRPLRLSAERLEAADHGQHHPRDKARHREHWNPHVSDLRDEPRALPPAQRPIAHHLAEHRDADAGGEALEAVFDHPQLSNCCSSLDLIAAIVSPFDAVEAARAHATCLEIYVRNRRGTGHCARASRPVPCRHARRDRRAGHAFPKDNPLLRLDDVSKAGEVFELVTVAHDTPP